MKYEIHPAAELFPLMSEEELSGLIADINENGQREAVTFWNGKLIDGRNRATACERLGIDLDTCELDEDTDPIRWVLSHNLHRRHLSASQRAMVAAKVRDLYDDQAKDRQKRKPKSVVENLPQQTPAKARDEAGASLSVSGKTVDHATTVLREGSKDLIAAVESGEVSVSRAAKIAKTESKPCQLAAAKAEPIRHETPNADERAIAAIRKAENRLVVAKSLIDICEPHELIVIQGWIEDASE